MKITNKIITRIQNSSNYSVQGFIWAFKNEEAFRWECILFVPFFIVAFYVKENWLEFCILIIPLFLVLIFELLNTAIEKISDKITLEQNELIKIAKDCSSASVFFSFILTAIIWLIIICN